MERGTQHGGYEYDLQNWPNIMSRENPLFHRRLVEWVGSKAYSSIFFFFGILPPK